jgi:GntR family transcriptional regulator
MTDLAVDLTSPTPVYEQIRGQVAALVAVGALTPGDRLPASRDLARDLGIAVGTVQRAYRELEASGVVTSRRRTGTVVADGAASGTAGSRTGEDDGRERLVDDVRRLVARAREAGVDDAALLDVVRGVLREP